MGALYYCGTENRRNRVRNTLGQPLWHGIDYIEVVAHENPPLLPVYFLHVYFLHDLSTPIQGKTQAPTLLTPDNIRIEGGVRIKGIRAVAPIVQSGKLLSVPLSAVGDSSTYTFRLVVSKDNLEPPEDFDPLLSAVDFIFPQQGPSEFDCPTPFPCLTETLLEPQIDYLTKDYDSFRRLMLDRLSALIPEYGERNPADQQIALVELLAYVGDRLSYYQDAVATEAYLGTARKRISVRRHARLLDYPMHDGRNARAWIAIRVEDCANGQTLPGPDEEKRLPGALFLTKTSVADLILPEERVASALAEGAQPFETMENLIVYRSLNEIPFYTWGEDKLCLPKGTTKAVLECAQELPLNPGRILIFEERIDLTSTDPVARANPNPAHRHAVRLTRVGQKVKTDNLTGRRYVEIEWGTEDALPFPLWIGTVETPDKLGPKAPISVALGNVVLADHGISLPPEEVDGTVPDSGRYRPRLKAGPITQQAHVYALGGAISTLVTIDANRSAQAAMNPDLNHIVPAIKLIEKDLKDHPWLVQRDLLDSNRFDRHFVAEIEDDGGARLRFGDGQHGEPPDAGASFAATYRVGNGRSGNIGPGTIAHVVFRLRDGQLANPLLSSNLQTVYNPLAAQGGLDPEPLDQVRRFAPQAFRRQERAVTAEDYARRAETYPEVQKAVASLRWTGSWHTVFVCIDRQGGLEVDAEFRQAMRRFLERYRLAGHDLEVNGPQSVPLVLELSVTAKPGYYRSTIRLSLLQTFSSRDLPNGQRGFFHPDNFSFGQSVYLSEIYRVALQVAGVESVTVSLQRQSDFSRVAVDDRLSIGPLEIARLDNDPNLPENGIIRFDKWQGGL